MSDPEGLGAVLDRLREGPRGEAEALLLDLIARTPASRLQEYEPRLLEIIERHFFPGRQKSLVAALRSKLDAPAVAATTAGTSRTATAPASRRAARSTRPGPFEGLDLSELWVRDRKGRAERLARSLAVVTDAQKGMIDALHELWTAGAGASAVRERRAGLRTLYPRLDERLRDASTDETLARLREVDAYLLHEEGLENERQRERAAAAERALETERSARELRRHRARDGLAAVFERSFLEADDWLASQPDAAIDRDEHDALKTAFVMDWARHALEPVDRQQALAMGTVKGDVLLCARAGSGKTRTLVARAAFLERHCGVPPHQVLILAFNHDAVDEIKRRVGRFLGGAIPHVMTFHALAYRLVHPENAPLHDADGERESTMELSRLVQDVIVDRCRQDGGTRAVRSFEQRRRQLMLDHFREDWDRMEAGRDHRDKAAFLRERRANPGAALEGHPVKSHGEKVIADFLFEHDVDYGYERNVWWDGRNYRPDFSIYRGRREGTSEEPHAAPAERSGSDGGIGSGGGSDGGTGSEPEGAARRKAYVVIEYFGMIGEPGYDDEVKRKRDYWAKRIGDRFLELYPRDVVEVDALHARLLKELRSRGIPCRRLTDDEVWKRLRVRGIQSFTKAVRGFIQRCRKLSLTPAAVQELIQRHEANAYVPQVEAEFLDLAHEIYGLYLRRIEAQEDDDFDGLLQKACARVREGHVVFDGKDGRGSLRDLRFLLIDEHQDFSDLFHRFVQAVRGQNPALRCFAVGDDWQAINAFAGSDLRFFSGFERDHEGARRLQLSTNYRSAAAIVGYGNKVMEGRGAPAEASTSGGKVLIADLDAFRQTLVEEDHHGHDAITPATLRLIRTALAESDADVVLLSRRKKLPWFVSDRRDGMASRSFLEHVRSFLPAAERKRVRMSTVHSFKGQEATVAIVLDAIARSFPLIHPNWIFTRVFGDTEERVIDEERRLFYVGVTRARKRLVLVTSSDRRSPFLVDAGADEGVSDVQWDELRGYGYGGHELTVVVRTAPGTSEEEFDALKEALRQDGFAWRWRPHQGWTKLVPRAGFDVTRLRDAAWSRRALGVEVEVVGDRGDMLEAYSVTLGEWHRRAVGDDCRFESSL